MSPVEYFAVLCHRNFSGIKIWKVHIWNNTKLRTAKFCFDAMCHQNSVVIKIWKCLMKDIVLYSEVLFEQIWGENNGKCLHHKILMPRGQHLAFITVIKIRRLGVYGNIKLCTEKFCLNAIIGKVMICTPSGKSELCLNSALTQISRESVWEKTKLCAVISYLNTYAGKIKVFILKFW